MLGRSGCGRFKTISRGGIENPRPCVEGWKIPGSECWGVLENSRSQLYV